MREDNLSFVIPLPNVGGDICVAHDVFADDVDTVISVVEGCGIILIQWGTEAGSSVAFGIEGFAYEILMIVLVYTLQWSKQNVPGSAADGRRRG